MRRDRREHEFTEYFAARAAGLRRTAYLVVRDWHVAEDVVQVSFVKLYAAWPRVRDDGLDAYMRRIVVNESLGWLRRRRPETPTDVLPEAGADGQHGLAESPLDLGAALDLLPCQQRAVVALRFLDDLSVAEVARVLDIAEGTVKSQTSRALSTLRARIPELVLTEEI
jgi:RNA polymerase sigma-70 factor (sigma-E family)